MDRIVKKPEFVWKASQASSKHLVTKQPRYNFKLNNLRIMYIIKRRICLLTLPSIYEIFATHRWWKRGGKPRPWSYKHKPRKRNQKMRKWRSYSPGSFGATSWGLLGAGALAASLSAWGATPYNQGHQPWRLGRPTLEHPPSFKNSSPNMPMQLPNHQTPQEKQ